MTTFPILRAQTYGSVYFKCLWIELFWRATKLIWLKYTIKASFIKHPGRNTSIMSLLVCQKHALEVGLTSGKRNKPYAEAFKRELLKFCCYSPAY